MTKTVMPIREQKLNDLLEEFEKDCRNPPQGLALHHISKVDLNTLRTKIIHLISDEYLPQRENP